MLQNSYETEQFRIQSGKKARKIRTDGKNDVE